MIVVNFKTYSSATGKAAKQIGKACETAMGDTEVDILAAPQSADLLRLEDLEVKVFSQHTDPVSPGSHTGSTVMETVKQAGAEGTLINHSEKRIPEEKIRKTVERAREKNLTTIVCAQSPEECGRFAEFKPDYIAYEPPELIGGDTSVSDAHPELISRAVEESGDVPTLTGAGIKDHEDVRKSLEHGCKGVLIASGVIKTDDSLEELKELIKGYEQ